MKVIEKTHKKFSTVQSIRDYFADKSVHCVSCHTDFETIQVIETDLHNSNAIALKTDDGTVVQCVPRIPCSCGYKNTVLKLLYQTH